jgi:SagB-type dehydrogenase family enzyme
MSRLSPLLEEDGSLFSVSALFHENTKIGPWEARVELTPLVEAKLKQITQAYKTYPAARIRLKLPDVSGRAGAPLCETIEKRRSRREFADRPLTLEEMAVLLHYSYGLTYSHSLSGSPKAKGIVQSFRAAPSGGALYPIEIYPALFNVEGTEPGIYHYNVQNHELELVHLGDYQATLWEYTFRQSLVKQASFMLVLTGIPARVTWKYRERGYRYILIEAGHIAQNTYLVATASGIGICTIGGFLDDQLCQLMFLDGVQEFPIYIIAGGKLVCD